MLPECLRFITKALLPPVFSETIPISNIPYIMQATNIYFSDCCPHLGGGGPEKRLQVQSLAGVCMGGN